MAVPSKVAVPRPSSSRMHSECYHAMAIMVAMIMMFVVVVCVGGGQA